MSSANNKNKDSSIRRSPLGCLPVGPDLSPSGLLLLESDGGEVELLVSDGVQLRVVDPLPTSFDEDGKRVDLSLSQWVDRDSDLIMTVTTHRVVLERGRDGDGGGRLAPRFLHLSGVSSASSMGGGATWFGGSAKISLRTHAYGEDVLLVFKEGGTGVRDDALAAIRRSVSRRAWEEAQREEERTRRRPPTDRRRVGVDAVVARNKARHEEAARVSESAFSGDADRLLEEAKGLVAIIHRYVATLETKRGAKQENLDDDDDDDVALSDMLRRMGMTDGLSRDRGYRGSDKVYYDRLARRVADVVAPHLKRAGGTMTLTDVYCLFNRARGTNLVSPDDLLRVLPLLSSLGLGMSSREFAGSGVRVLQDDRFDDDAVARRLRQAAEAQPDTGLTALDASRVCGIPSVLVVAEHLHVAEKAAVLCRDTTVEGTRYFPNLFLDPGFEW